MHKKELVTNTNWMLIWMTLAGMSAVLLVAVFSEDMLAFTSSLGLISCEGFWESLMLVVVFACQCLRINHVMLRRASVRVYSKAIDAVTV